MGGGVVWVGGVCIVGDEGVRVDAIRLVAAHRLSQEISQLPIAFPLKLKCVGLLQTCEKFIIHGLS